MSNSNIMTRAKDLIGSRVSVRNDDYGVVIDVVSVVKNDITFCVVITDRNRRIEANSLFNNLTSATNQKVYPDGTAYSKRFAGPKSAYRATPVICANIPVTACINNVNISITSYLSSHDNCNADVASSKDGSNV